MNFENPEDATDRRHWLRLVNNIEVKEHFFGPEGERNEMQGYIPVWDLREFDCWWSLDAYRHAWELQWCLLQSVSDNKLIVDMGEEVGYRTKNGYTLDKDHFGRTGTPRYQEAIDGEYGSCTAFHDTTGGTVLLEEGSVCEFPVSLSVDGDGVSRFYNYVDRLCHERHLGSSLVPVNAFGGYVPWRVGVSPHVYFQEMKSWGSVRFQGEGCDSHASIRYEGSKVHDWGIVDVCEEYRVKDGSVRYPSSQDDGLVNPSGCRECHEYFGDEYWHPWLLKPGDEGYMEGTWTNIHHFGFGDDDWSADLCQKCYCGKPTTSVGTVIRVRTRYLSTSLRSVANQCLQILRDWNGFGTAGLMETSGKVVGGTLPLWQHMSCRGEDGGKTWYYMRNVESFGDYVFASGADADNSNDDEDDDDDDDDDDEEEYTLLNGDKVTLSDLRGQNPPYGAKVYITVSSSRYSGVYREPVFQMYDKVSFTASPHPMESGSYSSTRKPALCAGYDVDYSTHSADSVEYCPAPYAEYADEYSGRFSSVYSDAADMEVWMHVEPVNPDSIWYSKTGPAYSTDFIDIPYDSNDVIEEEAPNVERYIEDGALVEEIRHDCSYYTEAPPKDGEEDKRTPTEVEWSERSSISPKGHISVMKAGYWEIKSMLYLFDGGRAESGSKDLVLPVAPERIWVPHTYPASLAPSGCYDGDIVLEYSDRIEYPVLSDTVDGEDIKLCAAEGTRTTSYIEASLDSVEKLENDDFTYEWSEKRGSYEVEHTEAPRTSGPESGGERTIEYGYVVRAMAFRPNLRRWLL